MIGHVSSSWRARRSVSILALLGLVLALFAPSAAAQGDETDPAVIVANSIDATKNPTEVVVLADSYRFGVDRVSVVENGESLAVDSVQRATASGRPLEMVYVIDTSNRNARGDVLAKVKTEVASAIRALPAGTVVSVVDAGDSAVVRAFPTQDLEAAAQAVERLDMSSGASLFNALDRAASLVAADSGRIATVVLFAGGEDIGSEATVAGVENALSRAEVQLISVRYDGGGGCLAEGGHRDRRLRARCHQSRGHLFGHGGGAERRCRPDDHPVPGQHRQDRTKHHRVIGRRRDDRLLPPRWRVAHQAGELPDDRDRRTVGLRVLPERRRPLPRHRTGLRWDRPRRLLVRLGLRRRRRRRSTVFIDRYSGEAIGDELDDEESQIVQTALVRRAVEMSESFAEDRGFLTKVEEMLERAKVPLRAGEAMSFWIVITLVSGALGMLLAGGLIGGLIFAVIGAFMQIFVLRFKAQRRMRKFEQQLPDTLQLLAGTLRAGYSLPQGLEAVSHESADPMGFELRRVMTEARLGREMEEALAAAAERLSSPDFAWAVMAISIQREVGGNLNELLMTVSDTMIARERLKGEVAALTAEGKASAILLGGLPPGLGFVMWLMNPEYIELLFTETLGKIMLVAALRDPLTIGMTWMKKVMHDQCLTSSQTSTHGSSWSCSVPVSAPILYSVLRQADERASLRCDAPPAR